MKRSIGGVIVALLTFVLTLTLACSNSGSHFIGKWQKQSGDRSFEQNIEITKNGDAFLVVIEKKQIPFTLQKDGTLTGPFNATLTYFKKTDTLLFGGLVLFGGYQSAEYIREEKVKREEQEKLNAKLSWEEKFGTQAATLLKTMNLYFNNKDYAKMKDIYKPDGRDFSDPEWDKLTKGLGTWLGSAGKIMESKILSSNIAENEGVFQIQTTYEKKGQQAERLVVRLIDRKYYITSLE